MISVHKLLLVTLFCVAAQSLAQAQSTSAPNSTNQPASPASAAARPAPSTGDVGEASSTSSDIPLSKKRFTWPNLPYQADTGNGPRGTQQGFNRCNATTQNQDSMCQTTFLNSIQEFCLWGAPKPNLIVGDVEGEMVAYCTTKKSGARLIPAGAITGIQVTRTPGYIQAVGFIQQSALNIQAADTGGEEDPHGADERGNPLGALMYSSAFNTPGGPAYTQVTEWSYFIGSGVFCYKACDPAGPNPAQLCQHIYDRIGCTYNAPANYGSINGTFQSCRGENQLPAGTYIENGVTKTYQQPPESAGPITSIPYTAAIPAVSNCQTFSDPTALWPELYHSTPANNPTTASKQPKGSNAVPGGTSPSSSSPSGNASSNAIALSFSSALVGCALLATMMTI